MWMARNLILLDAFIKKARLIACRMPRIVVQDFLEMEKKTDLKISEDLARY